MKTALPTITRGLRARREGRREERVGSGTCSGSSAARGLRGVMRFCSISDAPSPSIGRPEIGGSGSPAPSTIRAGAAAAGGMPGLAVGRPAEGEMAPTLPEGGRSGIAKSVFAARSSPTRGLRWTGLGDAGTAPVAVGPAAAVALVDPATGGLRKAAFAGLGRIDTAASGAGCGGSPAAIRCRGAGGSAASWLAAGSAGRGAGGSAASWLAAGSAGRGAGGAAASVAGFGG